MSNQSILKEFTPFEDKLVSGIKACDDGMNKIRHDKRKLKEVLRAVNPDRYKKEFGQKSKQNK